MTPGPFLVSNPNDAEEIGGNVQPNESVEQYVDDKNDMPLADGLNGQRRQVGPSKAER